MQVCLLHANVHLPEDEAAHLDDKGRPYGSGRHGHRHRYDEQDGKANACFKVGVFVAFMCCVGGKVRACFKVGAFVRCFCVCVGWQGVCMLQGRHICAIVAFFCSLYSFMAMSVQCTGQC